MEVREKGSEGLDGRKRKERRKRRREREKRMAGFFFKWERSVAEESAIVGLTVILIGSYNIGGEPEI